MGLVASHNSDQTQNSNNRNNSGTAKTTSTSPNTSPAPVAEEKQDHHVTNIKSVPLYNTLAFLVPAFISDPNDQYLLSLWQVRGHQCHSRYINRLVSSESGDSSDSVQLKVTTTNPIIISPIGTPVHPCYTNEEVQLMSQPLDPNNPAHLHALESIPPGTRASPSVLPKLANAPLLSDGHYKQVSELLTKYRNSTGSAAILPTLSQSTYQPIGALTYQLAHYHTYVSSSWPERYGDTSIQLNPLFGEHQRVCHEYETDNKIDYGLEKQHDYNEADYIPFDSHNSHTLIFDFVSPSSSEISTGSWVRTFLARQPTSIPFYLFFVDITSADQIRKIHQSLDLLVSRRQCGSLEITDLVPFVFVMKNSTMLDEALISETHILDFCINICHFTNILFYHYDEHKPMETKDDLVQQLVDDNSLSFPPPIPQTPTKTEPTHFSVEKYNDDMKFMDFIDQLVLRLFFEQHAFSPTLTPEAKTQRYTKFGLSKSVHASKRFSNLYGVFPQYGVLADDKVNYNYWPYFALKKPLLNYFSPFIPLLKGSQVDGARANGKNSLPMTTPDTLHTVNPEALLGSKTNPFQIQTSGFVLFSDPCAEKCVNLTQLFGYPIAPGTAHNKRCREPKGPNFGASPPPSNHFFVSRRIFPSTTPLSLLDAALPQLTPLQPHHSKSFLPQSLTQATTSNCHFQAFSQISPATINESLFPELHNSLLQLQTSPNKSKRDDVVQQYAKQRLPLALPSNILHLTAPIQTNTITSSTFISPSQFQEQSKAQQLRVETANYDPEEITKINRYRKDFPLSIYTAQRNIFRDDSAETIDFSDYSGDQPPDESSIEKLQERELGEEIYHYTLDIRAGYISHRSSQSRDSNQIASMISQQPNNFSFGAFFIDLSELINIDNKSEPIARVLSWEITNGVPDEFSVLRSYNTDLSSLHYTPFTIWIIFVLPPDLISLDHIQTAHPELYHALLKFSADLQSPNQIPSFNNPAQPFSQRARNHAGMLTVAPYFVTPQQVPALWEYILRRSTIERLHLINTANHIGDYPDSV